MTCTIACFNYDCVCPTPPYPKKEKKVKEQAKFFVLFRATLYTNVRGSSWCILLTDKPLTSQGEAIEAARNHVKGRPGHECMVVEGTHLITQPPLYAPPPPLVQEL